MAKKGNVKKGFANYLLILFIAIIAAFFILVTVMLFSPFKSILGFKYFVYNKEPANIAYIKKDGQNVNIDFSRIENVDIDCGFSDVAIKRAKSKIDQGKIVIENNCSGFAREDHDTDFEYEVLFTDNENKNLQIKIKEPEGFVYFKKDITITLLTTVYQSQSFDNTNININSTKGNVFVGNDDVLNIEASNTTTIKSLNVKNTDGDIIFFSQTEKISNLSVKTNNGRIDARNNFKIDNLNINASKSKINFKSLTTEKAKLNLNNSEFSTNNFSVKNKADLNIKNGRLSINELNGTLTSYSMLNDMGSANIAINSLVNGYLAIPNANSSSINIGSVNENSQIYIRGKNSNVKLNKFSGLAIVETTKGSVNISTDESKNVSPRIDVKTTSGNISLNYKNNEFGDNYLNLKTSSGTIDLDVRDELAFILNILNTKNEIRTNKNIFVEGYGNEFAIPLKRNEGTKNINFVTDGKVTVDFIK